MKSLYICFARRPLNWFTCNHLTDFVMISHRDVIKLNIRLCGNSSKASFPIRWCSKFAICSRSFSLSLSISRYAHLTNNNNEKRKKTKKNRSKNTVAISDKTAAALLYSLLHSQLTYTHTNIRRTAKYAKSSATHTHTHLQAGRSVCLYACVCGIECTSWVALQLPSTKEKAAKLKRTPALTATERRLTAKRRQCIFFLVLDSMSACADQRNSGAAAERFARALCLW